MISHRTTYMIAGVIGLQCLSWLLVPLALLPNAPLDVIEGTVWGRQFALGYHKGPPLFAWLLGVGMRLMPGSLLPALLLSQLSLAIAYWSVWRLARRLFGEADAIVVLLLMTTIYFYGFPSPEFNPIILQMCFSALAGSFLYTALRDDRLRDWLIVGIAAGLGMLTRYSMAMYLLPLLLFVFIQPEARRHLSRPGPYAAAAMALLILLPHIVWVVQHDFITLTYIDHRAPFSSGWKRIFLPIYFVGGQMLAFLPPMLLLLIGLSKSPASPHVGAAPPASQFDRAYVYAAALGPVIFVIALALLLGRSPRSMWGAPLWVFVPLLAILWFGEKLSPAGRRRIYYAWPLAFLLPVLLYASAMIVGPSVMNRNKRVHFPGEDLAQTVTAAWRRETGRPLPYVIGPLWIAGNIGFYSADAPQVFDGGNPVAAPWINQENLRLCGGVVAWPIRSSEEEAMPAVLSQRFPAAEARPILKLQPPVNALPNIPFRFGWALLPPAGDCPTRR